MWPIKTLIPFPVLNFLQPLGIPMSSSSKKADWRDGTEKGNKMGEMPHESYKSEADEIEGQ